ncbi:hypothetical protein DOY81_015051 [Sarcophaga bullata]|nr:hypothetical protein DOY81_015051 [Sarcophaga bullata]
MFLFITILTLCFLLTFAADIVKFLKISKLFAPKQVEGSPKLKEDLRKAREHLEDITSSGAGNGEYFFCIQKMRAEQKVKDLEQQIRMEQTMGHLKGASVEVILNYG